MRLKPEAEWLNTDMYVITQKYKRWNANSISCKIWNCEHKDQMGYYSGYCPFQ